MKNNYVIGTTVTVTVDIEVYTQNYCNCSKGIRYVMGYVECNKIEYDVK